MEAENHRLNAASGESVPGASFARALEDWTRRVEAYVQEIEAHYEMALTRTFAIVIFVSLLAATNPLLDRLSNEATNDFSRIGVQIGIFISLVGSIGLIYLNFYRRVVKLRRLRRNLEILLWPYGKLLKMLSQTLEYGNIDEGDSALIQLKILEAELAYSRARRVISSRTPFRPFRSPVGEGPNVDRLAAEAQRLQAAAAQLLEPAFGDDYSRRDPPPGQASRKR